MFDLLIRNFRDDLVSLINGCGLPPTVTGMIMENAIAQLNQLAEENIRRAEEEKTKEEKTKGDKDGTQ